jgi:D-amino peptidase
MRYRATLFRAAIVMAGGAAALVGCQPGASPSDPWVLEDASPNLADGIRVLVLHDMEGLSGQDDPQTFSFRSSEYPRGQELLAADVNAVIDGLFTGGATEVHVVDGHGSGNPEPDIRADLLDSRAAQILRDSSFDAYVDLVERDVYDAVAVVGMHAKTGSGGFASHTYTLGMDIILNGKAITETELVGLSWGRVDVPVVFASGDDRLGSDLEAMPWIEYVTVKRATSASTAELRPVEEARAELRAAAQRAVQRLGEAKVMKIAVPIETTLRTVEPASVELLEGFPGIDYEDNSVTFMASDLREAYDGLGAVIGVATGAYVDMLFEEIRSRPEGGEIIDAFVTALSDRWFDVESGRWSPEEPPPAPPGRKYHGFR